MFPRVWFTKDWAGGTTAGKGQVGKNGVVRSPEVHRAVLANVCDYAAEIGWHAAGFTWSPIRGPAGNIEFLADLQPGEGTPVPEEHLRAVVEEAHRVLI